MFSIDKKDSNRNHPSPPSKKYITVGGGFVFKKCDNIDLFLAIFFILTVLMLLFMGYIFYTYCLYVVVYVPFKATVKKLVADYN